MKKDKFTIKAKKEGYKARSIYKLREINNRFNLIKKGDEVLDLGCWPGSWMQYCIEKNCKVTGIDKKETKISKFIKADVLKEDIFTKINGFFDVVLSDMAPNTSGIKELDEGGSFRLVMKALDIAERFLKPKGNLLVKMFESEDTNVVLERANKLFKEVKVFRPKATKKRSNEIYIIGKDKV